MKNLPQKERIIVIAGPTGVGKSAYGVEIAKKYNGEVVSADSVQVYDGLDIGSGKITEEEMQGVPHHMLSVAEPFEDFTVMDFLVKARSIISDIIARNKLPIVVGGSGLYINALLHGFNCGGTGANENLRNKLKELEDIQGNGYLHWMLDQIAPSEKINRNDTVRTIRALELLLCPTFDKDDVPDYDDIYDALLVIMDADRKTLDEMAEKRIKQMIDDGFVQEVVGLRNFHETKVLNSVGYREMKYYAMNQGDVSLDETINEMKQSYHALIKKQQTFFRWLKWDNKVLIHNWNMSDANAAIKKFVEKK